MKTGTGYRKAEEETRRQWFAEWIELRIHPLTGLSYLAYSEIREKGLEAWNEWARKNLRGAERFLLEETPEERVG